MEGGGDESAGNVILVSRPFQSRPPTETTWPVLRMVDSAQCQASLTFIRLRTGQQGRGEVHRPDRGCQAFQPRRDHAG